MQYKGNFRYISYSQLTYNYFFLDFNPASENPHRREAILMWSLPKIFLSAKRAVQPQEKLSTIYIII